MFTHGEMIAGRLYDRAGFEQSDCLAKCSRWKFDRGSTVSLVAFNWLGLGEHHKQHHYFLPYASFSI